MVKIAFVDDGIAAAHLKYISVDEQVDFVGTENRDEADYDFINHGTCCALVFEKYLIYKNTYIVDLKISPRGGCAQLSSLTHAIEWCINNGIDIINISWGTTNYFAFFEIKKAISDAIKRGIVIIAAMDNQFRYSLPACLYGVIGVKTSTLYTNGEFKLRWYPFDGIEITTSGQHRIEANHGKVFMTRNNNSFSAPVITAYVSNIFHLQGRKSYEELLKILEGKAQNTIGKHINNFYPYFWNYADESMILKKWDRNQYTRVVSPYIVGKKKINAPVILISAQKCIECTKFIKELIDLLDQTYTYKILSNEILQLPNNIIIPNGCNIVDFISCVDNLYSPDVLLLKSDEEYEEYEADVRVDICGKIFIRYDDGYNMSTVYSINEVNQAAAFVLALFE